MADNFVPPLKPPLAKDKITSSTKPVAKLAAIFLAKLFVIPFDRRLLAVLPIKEFAPPPNTNPVAAPKAVYLRKLSESPLYNPTAPPMQAPIAAPVAIGPPTNIAKATVPAIMTIPPSTLTVVLNLLSLIPVLTLKL